MDDSFETSDVMIDLIASLPAFEIIEEEADLADDYDDVAEVREATTVERLMSEMGHDVYELL